MPIEDSALVAEIREIHATSGGAYGSPRVHAAQCGRGVGNRRVTRFTAANDVVSRHKRRFSLNPPCG